MPAKFDLFRKKTLTKTEKDLPRLAIASFKYLSLHPPIPARLIIQVVNRAMLNIERGNFLTYFSASNWNGYNF